MKDTQENQRQKQPSTPLRLSPHFTLAEFVASGIALRHGIDNTPQPEHIENLRALCLNVLEPLRRRFGVLRITSGYRCPQVNAIAGGAPDSQHLRGEAADIHTGSKEASEKIYEFARKYLTYDQLLLEHIGKTGTKMAACELPKGRQTEKESTENGVVNLNKPPFSHNQAFFSSQTSLVSPSNKACLQHVEIQMDRSEWELSTNRFLC